MLYRSPKVLNHNIFVIVLATPLHEKTTTENHDCIFIFYCSSKVFNSSLSIILAQWYMRKYENIILNGYFDWFESLMSSVVFYFSRVNRILLLITINVLLQTWI